MKFKHPGQWYSPAWLLSGNVEPQAINAEYRYLRTKVRQRLDRLIKSSGGRYADTQWVKEAQQILEIGGHGPRAKALSLAAFHDWLGRKTTVTDIKKLEKQTREWMDETGWDLPAAQVADFWNYMDWWRERTHSYSISPSKQVIEMYIQAKKNGISLEDLQSDFDWWRNNYQYMEQIPEGHGHGSAYYRDAVKRLKARRKS